MDSARPIMWNVPHWAEITLYLLIPVVLVALAAGVVWRVRKWFLGQAEPGQASLGRELLRALAPGRLVAWARTALFQSRLSPDRFSLAMHLAIFWGMLVLAIGTALATVDQDFTNLLLDRQILGGVFYKLFELALDLFGLVLILGLGMAAYRRYAARPKRLEMTRSGVSFWDGFPFLATLFLITVTGFLIEGLRIAEGFRIEARLAAAAGPEAKTLAMDELALRERFRVGHQRQDAEIARIAGGGPVFPAAAWAPVGYGLGKVFAPLPTGSIRLAHQLLWWAHGLLAFGLIVAIPFTKAFHLLSSPINMLLRRPAPPGRLPVAAESGVRSVRDYTWRQLLQVDACTWCGKCQEVCPGHHTGFPLSPRDIVLAVDSKLLRTPLKGNGQPESLHDSLVKPEELWSCCTCRACEEICPVMIEHPRLIVDLRRHLVDQGQVDEGLQDALMNFQRYGNSFGQSARKRAEWTKSLDVTLKNARQEEVEYLWFVGDYASYDQRAQQVTRTIARVLHEAGVDVGLLLEKEQNAGNDVRRIGEEGLFSMLREKNLKELSGAKFRKLLTTDPHTYNTLKNEYQAELPSPSGRGAGGEGTNLPSPASGRGVGGEGTPAAGRPATTDSLQAGPHPSPLPKGEGEGAAKPVLHYTELLDELIASGALKPGRPLDLTVTYHDPCYLGRFNGVYEPPRRVLRALGVRLVEMPRHGPDSFCCGAGGGRIWMKDTPGIAERPAENRIKEALALPGVECLVVACPKDLIMFQDAVKTVGAEGRLRVADLGELVYEAMETSRQVVEQTA